MFLAVQVVVEKENLWEAKKTLGTGKWYNLSLNDLTSNDHVLPNLR